MRQRKALVLVDVLSLGATMQCNAELIDLDIGQQKYIYKGAN